MLQTEGIYPVCAMGTGRNEPNFDGSQVRDLTLRFLDSHANKWQYPTNLVDQVTFFLFFKAFRCFEAADTLISAGYGYETLILARSQLEALVDFTYVAHSDEQEERALDWVAYGETERNRNKSSLEVGRHWSEAISTPEELNERARRWKRLGTPGRAQQGGMGELLDTLGPVLSGWTHGASFSLDAYGERDSAGQVHYKLGPTKAYLAVAHEVTVRLLRLGVAGLCAHWRLVRDDADKWLTNFDKLTDAEHTKSFRQRKTSRKGRTVFREMNAPLKDDPQKTRVALWEVASDKLDQSARELVHRHDKSSISNPELLDVVCFLFFLRIFRTFRSAAILAGIGFAPESLIVVRTSLEALIDLAFIALSDRPDERALDWVAFGETQRLRTGGVLVYLPDEWARAIGTSTEVAQRAQQWRKVSIEERARQSGMQQLYDALYRELSGWMHGAAWTLSGYAARANEAMSLVFGPNKFWPNASIAIHAHSLNCQILRGTISLLCILWKLPPGTQGEWLARFASLTDGLLQSDEAAPSEA
jgi:hypothetical protein